MTQINRAELQSIRDLITSPQKVGKLNSPTQHQTPNQFMAGHAAAYGSDPDRNRKAALDFLDWQLTTSFWSHANAEEFGTGSHCAIFYGGQDGLTYFALKNNDREMLDKIVAVQCATMALESLHVVPGSTPHIVMPGARCWVANASSLQGGDADQRKIRDKRYGYLQGNRRVKLPANLDTALDWTGLWVLARLNAAWKAHEPWATPWPSIQHQIATAGPESLPPSRNGLTVERGTWGHRSYFAHCRGMLRPAYWSYVVYGDSKSEAYGCDPSWPKGEPGGALPANLPLPELGGEIKSTIKLKGSEAL